MRNVARQAGAGPVLAAWTDIVDSLRNFKSWFFMARVDIRLRYRRTVIGPFWMVLTMGMSIACLGVVFKILFKQELITFLPYLSAGIICWAFITLVVGDGCTVLYASKEILKNVPFNFMELVLRMISRNFLTFIHNLVIFVGVALYFGVNAWGYLPLFFVGVFLYLICGTWMALLAGIICARYRDVGQLITTVLSILFLVTPVFWQKELLGSHQIIALINPFNHYLEVLRAPLLGQVPPMTSYIAVLILGLFGWLITFAVFARTRHRIVYWL